MRFFVRFTQLRVRYGPFETLKARGVDLISSQSLRISLTTLYEDELPRLQSAADLDQRLSRDRILPFLLDHFELDENNNWLLRRGEAEARSLGVSIARYRAQTLDRFYLRYYREAIEMINVTLAEIDRELGGTAP